MLRYAFLEYSVLREFATEYEGEEDWIQVGTETETASTRAHVAEDCAGSRISPDEAQEADEKAGESPVTYAVQDGRMAAHWRKETLRVRELAEAVTASAAQRITLLESKAAEESSEIRKNRSGTEEILNFEESSFNADQSGLPAE